MRSPYLRITRAAAVAATALLLAVALTQAFADRAHADKASPGAELASVVDVAPDLLDDLSPFALPDSVTFAVTLLVTLLVCAVPRTHGVELRPDHQVRGPPSSS